MKLKIYILHIFILFIFVGICNAEVRMVEKDELIGVWRGKLDIAQGEQVQEFHSIIIFDGTNVTIRLKENSSA